MSSTEAVVVEKLEAVLEETNKIQAIMGIKHPGVLQTVGIDLVINIQFSDTRFADKKNALATVTFNEGQKNLYSPFKKAKNDADAMGIMRTALPQILEQIHQVNSSRIMILNKSQAEVAKSIEMLVQSVASSIRQTFTVEQDDRVIAVEAEDSSICVSDFVSVGTWNTPQAVGSVLTNASCIGITIQLPELYDTEIKMRSIDRIYKFCLNTLTKTGMDVNVLLGIAVNPALTEDETVREFVNDLHETGWNMYTRYELYRNEEKESWIPKHKKDIDTYLLPTDGKTYSTELLFMKAVEEEVEETEVDSSSKE